MKHSNYFLLYYIYYLWLALAPLDSVQAQDTSTFKYYVNGSISLRITPWENGRRTWHLYDLKGSETISLEEVRLSYSVRYDADFYENGAVRTIKIYENPGASMYWYEGLIRFSSNNEPLDKEVKQMPERHLRFDPKPWMYWDKNTRSWKTQQVMECNPVKD